MAFSLWDRIALRRRSPRERRVSRLGCNALCRHQADLREWDSNARRRNSERDCGQLVRRVRLHEPAGSELPEEKTLVGTTPYFILDPLKAWRYSTDSLPIWWE